MGILLLAVMMVLVVPFLLQVALVLALVVGGESHPLSEALRLIDLSDPTPVGLAYINLALAALIPAAWFVTRVVHGLKPRLADVGVPADALEVLRRLPRPVVRGAARDAGRERGAADHGRRRRGHQHDAQRVRRHRQAVRAGGAAADAAAGGGGGVRLPRLPHPGVRQASSRRWVAVAGPALLFAFAHGAQSAPVFFDRFAFGLVAGILVVRTGGLEAGIAMHVLNNWLAFSLALAFGDMGEALTPTGGTWWSIPVTLTQSLVFLGLTLLVARRMGLSRTADPAVLAASRGRV